MHQHPQCAGRFVIGQMRALAIIFALSLCWVVSELSAQSIGVELGLAGIENYDPVTPTAGISLYMPVAGRLSVSATYARWTGRDGNESFNPPGTARSGYGNQAVVLNGLVRLFDPAGFSTSLGAGIGWFQHFVVFGGEQETRYDRTPMGIVILHYQVNPRLSPYLRADVQIPDGAYLNYGLFRMGLDIRFR